MTQPLVAVVVFAAVIASCSVHKSVTLPSASVSTMIVAARAVLLAASMAKSVKSAVNVRPKWRITLSTSPEETAARSEC
ncbi:MAG TPA: hypothetical protein VNF45_03455 [Candidatus Binataceae bacterium]|nr:hypothetical protein [Candidatus Binataceae bacterium]